VIAQQKTDDVAAVGSEVDDASDINLRQKELTDVLGEDGFAELLDSFFSDAASILGELSLALKDGDARSLDRMLHSLKGAASNVGLQDIADRAQRLREVPVDTNELLDIKRAVDTRRQSYAA
jgi:HPt (histidine-containing phosphotransfer) domain-containing protein